MPAHNRQRHHPFEATNGGRLDLPLSVCPVRRSNGRHISFRLLHVWEFKDGRMSRENVWLDSGAIIAQLTVLAPSPAS